jgi:Response regulators consisting of a CheY-like receiver domain and a winged-helix DNA-binding domain
MIVEDDPSIRSLVSEALSRWGYEVVAADPQGDVVAEFACESPHLLILDVGLPRLDGYEWCERVRAVSRVPILFATARSQLPETLRGLAAGGDDWLSKPFEAELLVAKVRALLRRAYSYATDESPLLERGGLVLDRDRGEARVGENSVRLTRHETILLATLLERDGRVASRDELMDALWSDEAFVDENTLNVNVARLRSSLASIGLGDLIETLRGQGYRLK